MCKSKKMLVKITLTKVYKDKVSYTLLSYPPVFNHILPNFSLCIFKYTCVCVCVCDLAGFLVCFLREKGCLFICFLFFHEAIL